MLLLTVIIGADAAVENDNDVEDDDGKNKNDTNWPVYMSQKQHDR